HGPCWACFAQSWPRRSTFPAISSWPRRPSPGPRRSATVGGGPSSFAWAAIAVSRGQQAKALELRAAIGLVPLRRDQGRHAEARDLLAPVYGWFTEGFDTPDLKEAKALRDAGVSRGRPGVNGRFLVNPTIRWCGREGLLRV